MFNNTISRNNIKNVFVPEIQNTEFELGEKVYYITISSKLRNTTYYPSVSSYTIPLNQTLKNIKSIELIKCILPDKNNVQQEPFLVLSIDEIKDVTVSNDRLFNDALHIISLNQPTASGYFININVIDNKITKIFPTPLSSLNKISIKLLKHDNTIFDFGGTTDAYQNLFLFKIVCIEKDFNKINSNII